MLLSLGVVLVAQSVRLVMVAPVLSKLSMTCDRPMIARSSTMDGGITGQVDTQEVRGCNAHA